MTEKDPWDDLTLEECLDPALVTGLQELGRATESAHVIWTVAIFDDCLEKILRHQFPRLTNNLAEKLFEGYGPFATFSAKIDVLVAMGVINGDIHRDLRVIRKIRNKFAHPKEPITFKSESIVVLLKGFKEFKQGDDALAFFSRKIDECVHALHVILKDCQKVQCDTSPQK